MKHPQEVAYMIWDPYIGFCSFPGSKEDREKEFKSLKKSLNKGARVIQVEIWADLSGKE